MAKRREIRNSTAEFLIFQIEGKEQGIEVYYKDKTVWCTQKAMGMLFDCSTDNIGLHLKNIFASGELVKDSVTEKISATVSDGKKYMTQFYNLDAVISVGYRVNSIRATQFRQWATSVLREYAIRGYVLDRKRMENGTFLDEDYFEPFSHWDRYLGMTAAMTQVPVPTTCLRPPPLQGRSIRRAGLCRPAGPRRYVYNNVRTGCRIHNCAP